MRRQKKHAYFVVSRRDYRFGFQFGSVFGSYMKIQTLTLELYWGDLLKIHLYIKGHDLTSTIRTLMVDLEGDECGAGCRDSDTIILSTEELRLN